MNKHLLALIFLITLLAAGAALADQPVAPAENSQPVLTAQQPETPAESAVSADQPVISEEENRKPPHVFGLALGTYTPMNSDVKDVFGGTKIRAGLRPLLTETPERARFMYDISFIALDHEDDQAILIPLTVGLLQGFGQDTRMQSYAAINAGMFYGNVQAPSVGAFDEGWGFTANATVGICYNKRLTIEARYEIMDKFAGFNFNSLSLMAGYRILQWRF